MRPTLAKVLAAWKLSGWQRQYGRAPEGDDLIAPDSCGVQINRCPQWAVRRFHEDLALLALRSRRQHDARRTFVSLARGDGAGGDIIDLVTHGPSGSMLDLYTRMPWAPTLLRAAPCHSMALAAPRTTTQRLDSKEIEAGARKRR